MQGEYQGLKIHVQSQNPRAIYKWYFAHVLNLIIVDVCESSMDIKTFILNIQAFTTFMAAKKRTADLIESQQISYPNDCIQRIKNLLSTCWTSHDRAINCCF